MLGKSLKFLIGLALIAYLFTLILARAPAELAIWGIQQAAPNAQFAGVTGSLWNGKAELVQVKHVDGIFPLGQMQWKLKPLSLLILSPCLNVELEHSVQSLSGDVCHGVLGGTTSLEDFEFTGMLDEFDEILPMRAAGNASLNIEKAKLRKGAIEALSGQMSTQNLKIHTGEFWVMLGDYGGKLSSSGNQLLANVLDISAPMGVDMEASWAPGSQYQVNATVTLKDETPENIKQAVQAFGEEKGDNTYLIQM